MRNVWTLTVAQAFAGCSTSMLVAFGGIIGATLAPNPSIATLPWSITTVGMAVASLPAALLMQRIGRRPAFVGSALLAALAALVFAWGIAQHSFVALCSAGFFFGLNSAFVQQYRFAATEFLAPSLASRAIATVMLGTLAAAVVGPAVGVAVRNLGGWPEFTGSFIVLSALLVVAALILTALDEPSAHVAKPNERGRSLRVIAAQPQYLTAVVAGVAAYASMSFVMTATPISMHLHDHISNDRTSLVISSHLLAMYLPSLASGWLATRLTARAMLLIGVAAMSSCILISTVIGHQFGHYLAGLVLLGFGWNFMFIAATTLLTKTYTSAERFRAQGSNDLAIFGSQALASLLAGVAIERIGWQALNAAILPLLVAATVAAYRLRPSARGASAT